MTPTFIAVVGLALVLIAWGFYLAAIPKNAVPKTPYGSFALLTVGAGAAIYALITQPAIQVVLPAVFALMMVLVFVGLFSQRRTPQGDLKVATGDSLIPFNASTSDGATFDSTRLDGQRTLLKFFRGSW